MPLIYHEGYSLGDGVGNNQLLKDTVGWIGKNLLKNTATSQTINGVTFTVNDDGSVTANGTATSNGAELKLHTFGVNDTVVGKQLILSGCPTGGGATTYRLMGFRVADASGASGTISDTGEGETFDYLNNLGTGYISLQIRPNYTANNLTFYPMLRRADILDDTYEPYHESVGNVVEQVYADNGVLGAKNLLENKAASGTLSGITFTVNSDGSVTANGTATANVSFVLKTKTPLVANQSYILSRGGSGDNDFQVVVSAWNSGTYVKNIIDVGAGGYTEKPFTPDYNGYNDVQISIWVRSGKSLSNAIVYPMIRLASDPDDTYQPYAMTNRELTEDRYYHAGDTVDVTGSTFGAFISGGATEIVFTIPLLKDLSKINGISFGTTSRFSARTATGGYLFDTVNPNNYAVTIRKKVGNLLSLTIKKTDGSAFENGVNNSVLAIGFVTGSGQGSIITFS